MCISNPSCETSLSDVANSIPAEAVRSASWSTSRLRGLMTMASAKIKLNRSAAAIGSTNAAATTIANKLTAAVIPVDTALISCAPPRMNVVSSSWSCPERSPCCDDHLASRNASARSSRMSAITSAVSCDPRHAAVICKLIVRMTRSNDKPKAAPTLRVRPAPLMVSPPSEMVNASRVMRTRIDASERAAPPATMPRIVRGFHRRLTSPARPGLCVGSPAR